MTTPTYYSTGHVVLNIGLVRSDNEQPLNPTFVEDYLRHVGLDVREFRLFLSDTEPTAVAVIRLDPRRPRRFSCACDVSYEVRDFIAPFLKQEAIAIYAPQFGVGALEGPNAEAWGDFNSAYFLMPDGRKLSDHNL